MKKYSTPSLPKILNKVLLAMAQVPVAVPEAIANDALTAQNEVPQQSVPQNAVQPAVAEAPVVHVSDIFLLKT